MVDLVAAWVEPPAEASWVWAIARPDLGVPNTRSAVVGVRRPAPRNEHVHAPPLPSDLTQLCSMHGERDLKQLLASLEPVQRAGEFVFAVVDDVSRLEVVAAEATVSEDEGLTALLRREQADRLGIAYDYVAAWITLHVHSALDAVGLTAAISTALADAGLSCNVIAGYHHDHLLVPADRAAEAITVLSALSRGTRRRA